MTADGRRIDELDVAGGDGFAAVRNSRMSAVRCAHECASLSNEEPLANTANFDCSVAGGARGRGGRRKGDRG